MVGKRFFSVIVILLIFSMTAFAATTGKIMGKVIDKNTGKPLAGASILIEETSLGAYADADGSYFILQVPPGVYTVQCQIVGYATVRKQNVVVSADSTTTTNFQMEEKIAGREEVIVKAKRAIVQKDNTSSSKTFDSTEIEKLTDPSMAGVLKQQAGVVEGANDEIHVRGGRQGEVAYIIDGIQVNTGLTGGSNFNLQSNAIQEMKVVTGGFNAEYGGAMSGIVKVVTKGGKKEYHGSASYKTTRYLVDEFDKYGEDTYQLYFSGPIPNPFIKDLSFAASFEYDDDNGYYLHHPKRNFIHENIDPDYLVDQAVNVGDATAVFYYYDGFEPYARGWRPEEYNRDWKYYLNLSMRPLNNLKIRSIVNRQVGHSYDNYSDTDYRFLETVDTVEYHDMYTFNMVHTINTNMFHEFSSSVQYDAQKTGHLASGYEHYTNFNGWDTDTVYQSNVNLGYLAMGGGFYSYYAFTGFDPYYYNYRDEALKLSYALTYQIDRYNQLKLGVNYNQDNLYYEYYNGREAEITGADKYEVEPYNITAYVQDKIEVEDMVINIGARLERYSPNVEYYEDPGAAYIYHTGTQTNGNPLKGSYPTEGKIESEAKTYIMPRLGISYPLSDTGVFRFSYGHFYQYPSYGYLYAHIQRPLEDDYYGNPNLDAQKAIQYEVGFDQGLSDIMKFGITGFFKENKDVLSVVRNQYSGKYFYQYVNKDFAKVLGMDLSLTKRFADNYSFDISYSFMMAKGSASSPSEFAGVLDEPDYVPPVKTTYLNYDRRHAISSSIAFAWGKDEGLEIYGVKPFEQTELSLSLSAQSGLPYTRQTEAGDPKSEKNGSRLPWNKKVDLTFKRSFNVYKDVKTSLIIESDNVFNWTNVRNVDPYTGEPTEQRVDREDFADDKLGTYGYWMVKDNYTDLDAYGLPRIVRVGLEISF